MQAIIDLKVRPQTVIPVQDVRPRKAEGGLSRINRAISKFLMFQNDERLVQMDSPYRWFQ